jgi:anti-anti-sigma factor
MDIRVSYERARVPVTIFQLKDRINLGTIGQLTEKAQEAFTNGTRDLIIDLTHVRSITSAGLRALSQIYKQLNGNITLRPMTLAGEIDGAQQRKSHLVLLNPTPDVLKTLKIVGFDGFIDIYNDQQEALQSF